MIGMIAPIRHNLVPTFKAHKFCPVRARIVLKASGETIDELGIQEKLFLAAI